MEYEIWFCPDDIKRCVSGSKKKYVLDWPIVPNMWPVKMPIYREIRFWCLKMSDINYMRCTTSFTIKLSKPYIIYRNTIAGSFLGERIIIFFEKIRFAPRKTEFLNFRFLAKN